MSFPGIYGFSWKGFRQHDAVVQNELHSNVIIFLNFSDSVSRERLNRPGDDSQLSTSQVVRNTADLKAHTAHKPLTYVFNQDRTVEVQPEQVSNQKIITPSKHGFHPRSFSPTYKHLVKTKEVLTEMVEYELYQWKKMQRSATETALLNKYNAGRWSRHQRESEKLHRFVLLLFRAGITEWMFPYFRWLKWKTSCFFRLPNYTCDAL